MSIYVFPTKNPLYIKGLVALLHHAAHILYIL